MKKVNCGCSGTNVIPETHRLSEVDIEESVKRSLIKFYEEDLKLRPAQDYALFDKMLLVNTANAIITTPTNSGKSLLSYLLLLQKAVLGKKAVLIEPLRALAYEKGEELKKIANNLKELYQIKIKVEISTGDYRLTNVFLGSKPSVEKMECGQIIICTPERLDAISRMSESRSWFEDIELVCLDEAHLLGDNHRGPVIELLLAFFKTLSNRPRLVLMSATIGNAEELATWLEPCDVINVEERYPKLEKWIYCVDDQENINEVLTTEILSILEEKETSIIVFVYQTISAENYALELVRRISGSRIAKHDLAKAMEYGVAWFHSNMSSATKSNIISEVNRGNIRVTVSTTALGMGINLPATHVFVRDVSFSGYKNLDISDLMQMLGRAGRGNRTGTGVVCLNKSGLSKMPFIEQGLKVECLPNIVSALLPPVQEGYYGIKTDLHYIERMLSQVMGAINRFKSVTYTNLAAYLQNTLSGKSLTNIEELLGYLISWKLCHKDEVTNEYSLTVLGQVSAKCYMPPLMATNFGQFVRDLLSSIEDGEHIENMKEIDYLIMMCLISNEFKVVARYSKALEQKVHQYMEALPLEEKSYLYWQWISTEAECVWGSARIDYSAGDARKQVFQRVYTAMLINDLQKGMTSSSIKEFYKVEIDGIQEKIRDSAIWMLAGMEQMFTLRAFFYHLKENCNANAEQIRSVDRAFKRSSKIIFAIIGNLKYRSKLGELVRGVRRVFPRAESYPGEGTIAKLEAGGIMSIKDIIGKSVEELVKMGVQRKYADLIVAYIRKRQS